MAAPEAHMAEWLDLANAYNNTNTSDKNDVLSIIGNKVQVLFDSFNNIDLSKPDSMPSEASHLLKVLELLDEKVRPYNVRMSRWQYLYRDVFSRINELVDKRSDARIAFAACLSILPHIFRRDGLQNIRWQVRNSAVGETLLPAFFVAFVDLSFRIWQDHISQDVDEGYNSVIAVHNSFTYDKDSMIEWMFDRGQWFDMATHQKFECCRDFYADIADCLRYKVLKDEVFPERNMPVELQELVRKEFLGTYRIDYDKLMAEYAFVQSEKPGCECWQSEDEFDDWTLSMRHRNWLHPISDKSLSCPSVATYIWSSAERSWIHKHAVWPEGSHRASLRCKYDAKVCKGHFKDYDWVKDQKRLKLLIEQGDLYESEDEF